MSLTPLRKLPAILVVDDEVRSQEALHRTLEEDFEVFCASGADEGMAILEREQSEPGIRIVLCDQRMPGTTGVQFLKEVRDRWPDIVRIILSGYTDAEDIITGVNEAGIWQYLLKPWQPEQLLLTLQRAAEVWRLQQENQRLSLDLRTAEPVLKRHVETKQEKAKSSFGLAAVIRAPGSPLNTVCDLVQRVGAVRPVGDGDRRIRAPARSWSPAPSTTSSRRASKAFVTENCGALPDDPARVRAVRLQARRLHRRRSRTAPACSSRPMAARCSSTRSARPRRPSRSSCCACCRRASSGRSAAPGR